MRAIEISPGEWAVAGADNKIIKDGFSTNAAAWAWIDRHSDDGDAERCSRIRSALDPCPRTASLDLAGTVHRTHDFPVPPEGSQCAHFADPISVQGKTFRSRGWGLVIP